MKPMFILLFWFMASRGIFCQGPGCIICSQLNLFLLHSYFRIFILTQYFLGDLGFPQKSYTYHVLPPKKSTIDSFYEARIAKSIHQGNKVVIGNFLTSWINIMDKHHLQCLNNQLIHDVKKLPMTTLFP